MADDSWRPQNAFADVVAQEEKHKTQKQGRLCPEGKPLFYHCSCGRHGRTRIENQTSLGILGGGRTEI